MIQRLKPWVSKNDIEKGLRWGHELTSTLEETDAGILCVTRENMTSPWLLFEAGALSKKGAARVTPYLLGIQYNELNEPLKQFNAAIADKADTQRMVRSLNNLLGECCLTNSELNESFEKWWPDLESNIAKIPPSPKEPPPAPKPEEALASLDNKMTALTKFVTDLASSLQIAPGYPFAGFPSVPGLGISYNWDNVPLATWANRSTNDKHTCFTCDEESVKKVVKYCKDNYNVTPQVITVGDRGKFIVSLPGQLDQDEINCILAISDSHVTTLRDALT